jgi:hypothetical protein
MSIREELEQHCGEPADQRMLILRRELLRPIVTVQTAVHLFQQVGPDLARGRPDQTDSQEFLNTIKWLSEPARDLEEILDALTGDCGELPTHHRHN